MIDQGAIDQAEIHHLRRPRELQMVACAKAGEPVWPLKKFVTHSHAPSGSDQRKIGNRADMQIPRVVPTTPLQRYSQNRAGPSPPTEISRRDEALPRAIAFG